MTLNEALKVSRIVRRSLWDSYGQVVDTGVTLLFVVPEINASHSKRLSLTDVLATDWTSRYND